MKQERLTQSMIHLFLRTFYIAIELSNEKWKLGFTTFWAGPGGLRDLDARDSGRLGQGDPYGQRAVWPAGECAGCAAVTRLGGTALAARYLQTQGGANLVVDSAQHRSQPT